MTHGTRCHRSAPWVATFLTALGTLGAVVAVAAISGAPGLYAMGPILAAGTAMVAIVGGAWSETPSESQSSVRSHERERTCSPERISSSNRMPGIEKPPDQCP
jgi:peptidoglycan/LPS O-acetylase OafA/YrhL